ncbi:MAG: hypothetical protein OXF27_02615 [Acidobacteria bacterium]|nr:hypothetical protein [Acidobacteriota bacterium]
MVEAPFRSYGILESYDRTLLAMVTSLLAEAVLGRLTYGRWPHLASAYTTGISVGILIRSPFVWPYVAAFLVLALVRSWLGGGAWLAEAAPITGSMYQLFVFFMITDPRTTVRSRRAQCAVVLGVAVAEGVLRLAEVVYAPFYALFLVGPAAMLLDLYRRDAGREDVKAPGSVA